ncbi:SAM-dependent methyltransferase [Actinoallomurus spadix]|nr:SAM-dependent methyltransferase [Actinoallomurus spadix]MCO5988731.1 SAM-dependent methyltransferase [Actinoallomurus spadix]
MESGSRSSGFDPTMPNEARMIDYILGGKDNFAADRAVAERALALAPELPIMARESRHFLHRAVRFMVDEGIRQFVDVGCGLPTRGSVHEVAHATAPEARVVYADQDALVVNHAQALLTGSSRTAVIRADMRDPVALLAHPRLTELIDLRQPVGILLVGVLSIIPEDDVAVRIVEGFLRGIASGSYVAISHAISDPRPQVTEKLAELYQDEQIVRGSRRRNVRSLAEVEPCFEGLDLVEPGIVKVPAWRPDSGVPAVDPEMIWSVAGVGRKP